MRNLASLRGIGNLYSFAIGVASSRTHDECIRSDHVYDETPSSAVVHLDSFVGRRASSD
jgi:hypothetical protein